MIQQSPEYDNPYASICEAAGSKRAIWSQKPVFHQKGASMKTEEKGKDEKKEEPLKKMPS